MTDLVNLEIDNKVAHVQLNRPEKSNALNPAMFEAIASTIDKLSAKKAVRAIVLSGAGNNFCAGADVTSIDSSSAKNDAEKIDLFPRYRNSESNLFQYISLGWRMLEAPVIAALSGVAFGGGCQIALGADIRFASHNAKLSTMEIKWGLIPDMGISQTLRGLVREDIARELLYTGRVVEAKEALELGLVTRCSADPLAEAMDCAKTIAEKNPDAIKAMKKLLNDSWRSADRRSGLLLESELQQGISGSTNQREAVKAQLEGRTAVFSDQ